MEIWYGLKINLDIFITNDWTQIWGQAQARARGCKGREKLAPEHLLETVLEGARVTASHSPTLGPLLWKRSLCFAQRSSHLSVLGLEQTYEGEL